jgi:hypothetical protein
MAAGSLLTHIRPQELYREAVLGYDLINASALYATSFGVTRGLNLNKLISAQLNEYYSGQWVVPTLVALATGLTIKLNVTDDGTTAGDLGKAVVLEVTPYNLSAANAPVDYSLPASKGTATTGTVTLSSTSGAIAAATIAIVTANLAGLAAGGVLGLRIRRVGDNVADTCMNRVLLLGGLVTDT